MRWCRDLRWSPCLREDAATLASATTVFVDRQHLRGNCFTCRACSASHVHRLDRATSKPLFAGRRRKAPPRTRRRQRHLLHRMVEAGDKQRSRSAGPCHRGIEERRPVLSQMGPRWHREALSLQTSWPWGLVRPQFRHRGLRLWQGDGRWGSQRPPRPSKQTRRRKVSCPNGGWCPWRSVGARHLAKSRPRHLCLRQCQQSRHHEGRFHIFSPRRQLAVREQRLHRSLLQASRRATLKSPILRLPRRRLLPLRQRVRPFACVYGGRTDGSSSSWSAKVYSLDSSSTSGKCVNSKKVDRHCAYGKPGMLCVSKRLGRSDSW
mmetsp:Transcript_26154/g.61000  ORF Transcript_26154/g.61000 Transcript_26154/m.61000 type:complete len:320 (-) Transcript_26154:285-1244(-)